MRIFIINSVLAFTCAVGAGAHEIVHMDHENLHASECGHQAAAHGGHIDYLHDGQLQFIHGDHVDDQGPLKRVDKS